MSKINVAIYCDTTGLFSEEECDMDNICYMMFEESIVEEWFEEKMAPDVDYGFEFWYTQEYDCDETDGLYEYAVSKGDHPYFDMDKPIYVFYRDESNYKWIVFEGDLNECREFGRENEWMWHEYELEVSLL